MVRKKASKLLGLALGVTTALSSMACGGIVTEPHYLTDKFEHSARDERGNMIDYEIDIYKIRFGPLRVNSTATFQGKKIKREYWDWDFSLDYIEELEKQYITRNGNVKKLTYDMGYEGVPSKMWADGLKHYKQCIDWAVIRSETDIKGSPAEIERR